MIAEVLLAAEPGSRIVGEELSPEVVTGGLVWIVDPLDGTTNFLHDFPSYAVSIAAAVDGVLEAGVVVDVPRNRDLQRGSRRRRLAGERRLSVSDDRRARLRADRHRLPVPGQLEHRANTSASSPGSPAPRAASAGPASAALDLADVAAGRFDGFWEQRLSAWDIAAGVLLIREAGGSRDRLRRPRRRSGAHRRGRGESGDARVAARHDSRC